MRKAIVATAGIALALSAALLVGSCSTTRNDERSGYGGGQMAGGPPGQGGGPPSGGPQGGGPGGPPPGGMANAQRGASGGIALNASFAVSVEGGQPNQPLGLRAAGVVIGGRGASLGPVGVNVVLADRAPGDLRIDWDRSSIEIGGSGQKLFPLSQKYDGPSTAVAPATLHSGEALAELIAPLSGMAVDATTGTPRPSVLGSGPIRLRIAYNDTRDFAGAESTLVVVLTPVSE